MTLMNYEGVYRLTKVFDVNMAEIPVPAGSDSVKILHMDPSAVASSSASNDQTNSTTYDLGLTLGNRMGGRLTVAAADDDDDDKGEKKDAVTISTLRSTRMLPPPPVFRVEVALSDMLPAAEWIHFEDNDNSEDELLIIEGPKGSMHCTRLN